MAIALFVLFLLCLGVLLIAAAIEFGVMSAMLLFSISLIVIGMIWGWYEINEADGKPCKPTITLVSGCVMIIVTFVGYYLCYRFLDFSQETHVIKTIHLVSLGDTEETNDTTHQGFLSLTITEKEKPIYHFMYKKDDGLVTIGEIDASTPVKEINDGKPRIETVDYHYTNGYTRLLLSDLGTKETETTIYIPQDSIVQDFDIDTNKLINNK